MQNFKNSISHFELAKKKLVYFSNLNYPNLICAVSSKQIGDLRTKDNKGLENFCRVLEIEANNVVKAEQIHGNVVKEVNKHDCAEIVEGVDGLLTKSKNIYLFVVVADCLPIVFFDPKQQMVGVVHAGWKGSSQNIAGGMVKNFAEIGSDPKDILVGIGPSICQKHYEVGREVAVLFEQGNIKEDNHKFYLDLRKINNSQLIESGINPNNIDNINFCTFEEKDAFYSWRREKPNLSGEFGLIAGLKS